MQRQHHAIWGGIIGVLLCATGAIANPNRAIEFKGEKVQSKTIAADAFKVTASYTPIRFQGDDTITENNVTYKIFHNGKLQVTATATTFYSGQIQLQDLDNNGTPEVWVRTFSGGAHCCTNFKIYTWQNDRFITTETGYLDGGGGTFKDLDGDGSLEFVSFDQSFLYQFSSYAASFPPSRIYRFRDGKLVDATRQFPDQLRSTAWRMYQAVKSRNSDDQTGINGVLAGYVAQKILLGEYEQGWQFMLAHYNREDRWGLEQYDANGKKVGEYPDFPIALRAFLQKQGYLDRAGRPTQP